MPKAATALHARAALPRPCRSRSRYTPHSLAAALRSLLLVHGGPDEEESGRIE
uniref:Uncharacterized protein n=1 Tax=Arundo donax TaxID=35708 RepID=A0A0A9A6E4_ARUDO